jgi:hypothetical protein
VVRQAAVVRVVLPRWRVDVRPGRQQAANEGHVAGPRREVQRRGAALVDGADGRAGAEQQRRCGVALVRACSGLAVIPRSCPCRGQQRRVERGLGRPGAERRQQRGERGRVAAGGRGGQRLCREVVSGLEYCWQHRYGRGEAV